MLIPCWHDRHPLTCDNDTVDCWEDGWTRQPPDYQESIAAPGNTPITSQDRPDRYPRRLPPQKRYHDAVVNGLTLPWSSGVVEGNVNRIKMIKRQMYGRASLALHKRALLAP
jgi:hypothetical protein